MSFLENKKAKKAFPWLIAIIFGFFLYKKNNEPLPLIAIANYGNHSSLNAAIDGIKEELKDQGFLDKTKIEISDVSFDASLIRQMIVNLKSKNPKVFVTFTTPVSQNTKEIISKETPIVFCCVTDPVKSGLLLNENNQNVNLTGSSEKQDLVLFLQFVKKLLPNAKKVGMLYSTSESNDSALIDMMKNACDKEGMTLVALGVDTSNDVLLRLQSLLSENIDLIYVGASGPIQPTLPVITANAKNIPIFNVEDESVKKGLALASFGVNYNSIGRNAGKIVAKILKGEKNIKPIYPKSSDHFCCINLKRAKELGITIPNNLENATIIE